MVRQIFFLSAPRKYIEDRMENMHTDVRVERVMVQGLQQSSCRKLRLEFSLFFNGIALSSYVGKKIVSKLFSL